MAIVNDSLANHMRSVELKINVSPAVQAAVSDLYASWGMDVSDAVNIFFAQSLMVGGLPFSLRKPPAVLSVNRELSVPIAAHTADGALVPSDWYEEEDDVYDELAMAPVIWGVAGSFRFSGYPWRIESSVCRRC